MTLPVQASKIRLHLDSTDLASFTLDAEDRIDQWRDLSGLNQHFSAFTTHGKPILIENAVRFDPPSPYAQKDPINSRALTCPTPIFNPYPIDAFIVASSVANINDAHNMGCILATTLGEGYEFIAPHLTIHRTEIWNSLSLAVDWSLGTRLLHATVDPTLQQLRADWSQKTSRTTATRVPGGGISYLGVERPVTGNRSYVLKADVHEIVVLTGATDQDRAEISLYLNDRWPLAYPLTAISGTVKALAGETARAVVFDWANPAEFTVNTPDQSGAWRTARRISEQVGVYYLSSDNRCPPIIHGPYTAE